MREAYGKYNKDGFTVISISVQEKQEAVASFINRHDLPYPFALDVDGGAAKQYSVYTTPTTYFIGPDGTIVSFLPGTVDRYWLENNLQVALK